MVHTAIKPTIAFKEWAITTEELGKGTQIFVMRKGGIHEETRHFEIQSDEFLFYPAYEHQKKELLKPEYQGKLEKILETYSPEDKTITIKYFAKLYEDMKVHSKEKLIRLEDYHIGTNEFAFERLKWKMKQPLHLLLLRVYTLKKPIQITMEESHLGCKSWLQLSCDVPEMIPVLDEDVFLRRVYDIKSRLNGE